MTRTTKPTTWMLAGVLGACLALAACGGGGSNGVGVAAATPRPGKDTATRVPSTASGPELTTPTVTVPGPPTEKALGATEIPVARSPTAPAVRKPDTGGVSDGSGASPDLPLPEVLEDPQHTTSPSSSAPQR